MAIPISALVRGELPAPSRQAVAVQLAERLAARGHAKSARAVIARYAAPAVVVIEVDRSRVPPARIDFDFDRTPTRPWPPRVRVARISLIGERNR